MEECGYIDWIDKNKYNPYKRGRLVTITCMPPVCVCKNQVVLSLASLKVERPVYERLDIKRLNFFTQNVNFLKEIELDMSSVFLKSVGTNPKFSNTNTKVYLNFKSGEDIVTGVFGIKEPEESPRDGWSQRLPEFEKQFLDLGGNVYVGAVPRIERKKIVKTVKKRSDML